MGQSEQLQNLNAFCSISDVAKKRAQQQNLCVTCGRAFASGAELQQFLQLQVGGRGMLRGGGACSDSCWGLLRRKQQAGHLPLVAVELNLAGVCSLECNGPWLPPSAAQACCPGNRAPCRPLCKRPMSLAL